MKASIKTDFDKIENMSHIELMVKYKGLRYCEVSPFPYGCTYRNKVGQELIKRGITHMPNIFGDIPIRTNWVPL